MTVLEMHHCDTHAHETMLQNMWDDMFNVLTFMIHIYNEMRRSSKDIMIFDTICMYIIHYLHSYKLLMP